MKIERREAGFFLWGFFLALLLAVSVYGIRQWYKVNYPKISEISAPTHVNEKQFENLVRVNTPYDVNQLRKKIKLLIWGQSESPRLNNIYDLDVEVNFSDIRYDRMINLGHIDKYIVRMDYGINSVVYHFVPRNSNRQLVIFHEGHDADFYLHKGVIARLLESGFEVAAFSMPLVGMNNKPLLELPNQGMVRMDAHEALSFIRPKNGHSLRFFIDPVIAFLDQINRQHQYKRISMVGFSGGGWTTVLVAALDDRISRSYAVAGSLPINLKTSWRWGDWEQWTPELYTIANYPELYVLGSFGAGRRHIQLLNRYDSCCNGGIGWRFYLHVLEKKMIQLGDGFFGVYMDETARAHVFSDAALDFIMQDLSAN